MAVRPLRPLGQVSAVSRPQAVNVSLLQEPFTVNNYVPRRRRGRLKRGGYIWVRDSGPIQPASLRCLYGLRFRFSVALKVSIFLFFLLYERFIIGSLTG